MHVELNTKTLSLGGQSDLTVLAPIRKGLVPSLESITYKTRVKRLLEALQLLRESSHEYSIFRAVSDSAERVARIHSFRVAVIEPEDRLLLAVTFDGSRESYVRVLWQRIGTLLDLLFCSTEGHVPAHGSSLAEWDAWIQSIQVKTDFFYGRPGHTSEDVLFLRDEERHRRSEPQAPQADLASVRRATPRAEEVAWRLTDAVNRIPEAARQGIQAITVLHRLTAWFIPNTPDGDFLHRAARDLLPEFRHMAEATHKLDQALFEARDRFPEQIDWFLRPSPTRSAPAAPTMAPGAPLRRRIQGGILDPYELVTHGALLLLAFRPGTDPTPFWNAVASLRTSADAQPTDGRLVCNVAFTHEGLRAAGLAEHELEAFPLEFREGMAARCSTLGDVRTNHPRRWQLPRRNWQAGQRQGETVELAAVHVVLQLRIGNPASMPAEERHYDLDDVAHPLNAAIGRLGSHLSACMHLLSQEPLVRHVETPADPRSRPMEHFGYVDGNSDPKFDPASIKPSSVYRDNLVHVGEFLVGHANAADPPAGEGRPAVSPWLEDGSFLVVRKLSQDAALFDQVVRDGAGSTGLAPDLIKAKLMGRAPDGTPLAAPAALDNDFTYRLDPLGQKCPLHAHVRRANPRSATVVGPPELAGGRAPRLLRRSMSYGPRFDAANPAAADNPKPRGLLFMAYNASIAEQFEVVQRWLSGGNSTGGHSGRSDPFIGVPASGEVRVFSFEEPVAGGDPALPPVHRIPLDGDSRPEVLARTLVRLEWGMYLFTPSLDALDRLAAHSRQLAAAAVPVANWPWSPARGRAEIDRLLALPFDESGRAAWKAALEDPDAQKTFLSASIWAAIRQQFGGVLRTPYGVLAASRQAAMHVLDDPDGHYSVIGYRERTSSTMGDIYLGLDDRGPGCPYRARSEAPNAAIQSITWQQAFDAARRLARDSLAALVQAEHDLALARGDLEWQLTFGAKEVWDDVLEGLCREWFGLPGAGQSPFITPGRFRWDWDPRSAVLYPGNFTAPSRYIFQPRPGPDVQRIGSLHGTTMNAAFRGWVTELRDQGLVPQAPGGGPAPLAEAIFNAFPRAPGGSAQANAAQDALVAETLLGALIGFLPTVEGNLRQSLNEWLLDGTFWSLRAALSKAPLAAAIDRAPIENALRRSMQLRPSPEVVWRRATREHDLGGVKVQRDDTVVVAIVSATHECLEAGDADIRAIFGGTRPAGGGGRPTHACPGYVAATGTLMGILTALLESSEFLRPTPTPLSFRAEGKVTPLPAPAVPAAPAVTAVAAGAASGAELAFESPQAGAPAVVARAGAGKVLLLAGDSWFKFSMSTDLGELLRTRHGYEVDSDYAETGKALSTLESQDLDGVCSRYNELAQQGKRPSAILISAGGNDVVDSVLLQYVKRWMTGAGGGLKEPETSNMMDGTLPEGVMRAAIRNVLDRIAERCRDAAGNIVPVFWQGYDHPVPDGRNVFGLAVPPSWPLSPLRRFLDNRLGYAQMTDRVAVMKVVVQRFNEMLQGFAQSPAYSPFLTHADLRNTLDGTLAGSAHRLDWHDEMHPTVDGCAKLSDKLVTDYLVPVVAASSHQAP